MVLDYRKHITKHTKVVKDNRNFQQQFWDFGRRPVVSRKVFFLTFMLLCIPLADPSGWTLLYTDWLFLYALLYFAMLWPYKNEVPFKMAKSFDCIDPHNKSPSGKDQKAEGILYLGTEDKNKEEVWFNDSDARTHILYLGTTGSGKTVGLTGLVTNALSWGSGFIFIDGKADTNLWANLSALARRFGRDDDLLLINYMTGNKDGNSVSNTVNPFSMGSASYLQNLIVSLMPDIQGENQMWKDRAISLLGAVLPALTWLRDNRGYPLGINTISDGVELKSVIKLSRDMALPERVRYEIKRYMGTLPGYEESFYNDDGTPKGSQGADYNTISQQHGYLTMQFTKYMQSLGGDYGYIFENPVADIDMLDLVLNRRILVVLIPALEKSSDETANLGKIVGALLKGMMGATLGSAVEGDTQIAIENKPTNSRTPFMAVFDEVGYYTTQGMAVMAAQARSLGFSLVFAAQDLPALEKRVKEEARSITANCNIKIFGKLEDPTQTREFFEKTVGEALVTEAASRKEKVGMFQYGLDDNSESLSITSRSKAGYGELKSFKEGEAIINYGDVVIKASMFYSNPPKLKTLRVHRFLVLPAPDTATKLGERDVESCLDRLLDDNWTAESYQKYQEPTPQVRSLADGFAKARQAQLGLLESGAAAVAYVAKLWPIIKTDDKKPIVKEAKDTPPPAPEKKPPTKPELQLVADNSKQAVETPETETTAESITAEKTPKTSTSTTSSAAIALNAVPDVTQFKGADNTLSWAALAGEETTTENKVESKPAPKPAAKPAVSKTVSKKPDDLAAHAQNAKGADDALKWDDLWGDDDSTASDTTDKPKVSIPTTSFGLGGYTAAYNVQSPATVAQPVEKDTKKKIDKKPVTEFKGADDSLKWDDLL